MELQSERVAVIDADSICFIAHWDSDNKTFDKSIGTSKKSSVNLSFYSGSKISSNTLPGSPWLLLIPSLSTSSIKITGFSTSTVFKALTIFPG